MFPLAGQIRFARSTSKLNPNDSISKPKYPKPNKNNTNIIQHPTSTNNVLNLAQFLDFNPPFFSFSYVFFAHATPQPQPPSDQEMTSHENQGHRCTIPDPLCQELSGGCSDLRTSCWSWAIAAIVGFEGGFPVFF